MDEAESPANTLEEHFSHFGRRLREILGEGRIPRAEKKAKAKQAIGAADDLIGAIEEDLRGDRQSHPSKEPPSQASK